MAGRLSSGSSGGSTGSDVSMKYIVYKQPLSLDRFFIHEVIVVIVVVVIVIAAVVVAIVIVFVVVAVVIAVAIAVAVVVFLVSARDEQRQFRPSVPTGMG